MIAYDKASESILNRTCGFKPKEMFIIQIMFWYEDPATNGRKEFILFYLNPHMQDLTHLVSFTGDATRFESADSKGLKVYGTNVYYPLDILKDCVRRIKVMFHSGTYGITVAPICCSTLKQFDGSITGKRYFYN